MSHTQDTLNVLDKLVTCLEDLVNEAVSEGTLGARLCRCAIAPGGNVSYEYVGNTRCLDNETDGQGFVVLTGAYPSTRFPQPLQEASKCGVADLALNINVGIIRSYPIPENGEPASVEQQDAAVVGQMVEMGLIERAIVCCFADVSDADVLLGVYTPVGPAGAAVGGYWSVTIEGSADS